MKPKPIRRFRAYLEPGKSRLHYLVYVWRTKRDMNRAGNIRFRITGRKFLGFCSSYTVLSFQPDGKQVYKSACGEIHLYKNALTMEIITHEATHALVSWAKRVKLDPTVEDDSSNSSRQEERYCRAMGEMCRQIAWRCQDLFPK